MSVRPCASRLPLLSRKECDQSLPALGSSPRVQGKPTYLAETEFSGRLIPACAGKTRSAWIVFPSPGAHPRVCGENHWVSVWVRVVAGSSPRVRGKLHAYPWKAKARRLIPACAGKTRIDVAHAIQVPAHPRVCGENRVGGGGRWGYLGSSPRVRGKHVSHVAQAGNQGLIPACAGKTFPQRAEARSQWAHPRVCGENVRVHTKG